jgi:hypothetical protein
LRRTKLEPLDEPFDVFESILKAPGWTYSKRSEEDETLIALQLLRLVDYEGDKEKGRWSLLDFSVEIGGRSRFSEFRKSQIGQYRWSEQGNKYIKRLDDS